MPPDILVEEFEVLESIYPDELTKLSETDIEIDAEPDDPIDGGESFKITLAVSYTDGYPDTLPDMSLRPVDGELDEDEVDDLLAQLRDVGKENLGMAMTFTLVSHLRERLSELVRRRAEKRKNEEAEKERLVLEAEEARTRGTPVTVESFKTWKANFDRERALAKAREEEEKIKNLSAKEKEEWKRAGTRLSGRQLFERHKNLEDDNLIEEGVTSVDASQYERTRIEEEQEDEGVTFSDSD
ncbi:RWD-domain-containing protein [Infundibulicybe gibba]|nr:RWD-domain-containing protein [Infundibulicybe gibba]